MKVPRHSPSSLGLFCASPALFVLERVLGRRQPVGSAAHRGTAVEAGIAAGLLDPKMSVEDCVEVAAAKYWTLVALCTDPKVEATGRELGPMVRAGLEELRPYGIPSATQGFVEWRPEGLQSPIVGYFDFYWQETGVLTDLKTTGKLPSSIKIPHARQVALYASCISDNLDARVTYITPSKRATYQLENIRAHRDALYRIALVVERFLSLSDDPAYFATIVAPDFESFYFNAATRQAAFEVWGI